MILRSKDLTAFNVAYPQGHAKFRFALDQSAFSEGHISNLTKTMPASLLHYRGRERAPNPETSTDQTISDALRSINALDQWLLLRKIDDHATYAEIIDSQLHDILTIIRTKTARLESKEAQILLATANAKMPLNFNLNHNIYFQVRGTIKLTVFAAHNQYLPPQAEIEDLISRPAGSRQWRNLEWRKSYEKVGVPVTLNPGEALFIPAFAPFWAIAGGDNASLCVQLSWGTPATERMAKLHKINHRARQNGKNPSYPGSNPINDQVKLSLQNIIRYAREADIRPYPS